MQCFLFILVEVSTTLGFWKETHSRSRLIWHGLYILLTKPYFLNVYDIENIKENIKEDAYIYMSHINSQNYIPT